MPGTPREGRDVAKFKGVLSQRFKDTHRPASFSAVTNRETEEK